ncbi:MAG: ring-cleaving dioxygenase [Sphingobacteriales bacterium]|nr:MAG: ring-cleaving dioxygenase [Sphingobacteriales bacterium]
MQQLITGIHHVTATASDAQENIDFYTGVLGLRLVKKTVNFDNKEVYHFYYSNGGSGSGSILTFFPYQGLKNGRHGKGMLNTTTLSVDIESLDYWQQRLERFGIAFKEPKERFRSETVIYLEDADGMGLELVFTNRDHREGWANGIIPRSHSIKGFYSVELWEETIERTAALLTNQMNHVLIGQEGNRYRYAASDQPGHYVDLLATPDVLKGLPGSGAVHHIAFSTPNQETQLLIREKVERLNLDPTAVRDRNYFTSIYFREPGGVLFEVATAGPGFTADETETELGQNLKLPAQFEGDRTAIEGILPVISLEKEKFM